MKALSYIFLHFGIVALLLFGTIEYGTSVVFSSGQNELSVSFISSQEQVIDVREEVTQTIVEIPAEERIELVEIIENADTIAELMEALEKANISLDDIRSTVPVPGGVVARIEVPAVGINNYIVQGVKVADLRKGPGVFPDAPDPGGDGNFAVAGHRTTYGAPFADLDKINPGDEIKVTDRNGITHTYLADTQTTGKSWFIVSPRDVWVVNDVEDKNTITLIACHPKRSAAQRIVVTGTLISSVDETDARLAAEQSQRSEAEALIVSIETKLAELEAVPPVYVEVTLPSEGVSTSVVSDTETVVDTALVEVVESEEFFQNWDEASVDWNMFAMFGLSALSLWAAGLSFASRSKLAGIVIMGSGYVAWVYAVFPVSALFGI